MLYHNKNIYNSVMPKIVESNLIFNLEKKYFLQMHFLDEDMTKCQAILIIIQRPLWVSWHIATSYHQPYHNSFTLEKKDGNILQQLD